MTRDPNTGRATFSVGERDGGATVRAFMKSVSPVSVLGEGGER